MKCKGHTPIKLKCQGITTPVMALVTSAMVNEMLISMRDLKKNENSVSFIPFGPSEQNLHRPRSLEGSYRTRLPKMSLETS